MKWIPAPDNPNFEQDFLDKLYRFITKETEIYWALERLPDPKVPLLSSTRSKTASIDDEWNNSVDDNIVKFS